MNKKILIDLQNVPKHVAIIMDGNGRWAKNRGLSRVFGHKNAITAIRESVEAATSIGIDFVTLYTFSTENWNRPKLEVDALMNLLISSLEKELPNFQKNGIKINSIGITENLPSATQKILKQVIALTKNNTNLTLTLALSYGSREEIVKAIQNIAQKVVNSQLEIKKIDQKIINNHLYTFNLPNVDFLIRTSGEHRISNFLLWQIAYAELYFTKVLWPDFRKDNFFEAIIDYQHRERRFGKTTEQIESTKE